MVCFLAVVNRIEFVGNWTFVVACFSFQFVKRVPNEPKPARFIQIPIWNLPQNLVPTSDLITLSLKHKIFSGRTQPESILIIIKILLFFWSLPWGDKTCFAYGNLFQTVAFETMTNLAKNKFWTIFVSSKWYQVTLKNINWVFITLFSSKSSNSYKYIQ